HCAAHIRDLHSFPTRRSSDLKGPTCEPSSTSLVVSAAATTRPVSASTPMCSLRHDRRRLVPCFSTSHSPAPDSFNPVLSTNRCRSEEHTSELQSQSNLVCRLL